MALFLCFPSLSLPYKLLKYEHGDLYNLYLHTCNKKLRRLAIVVAFLISLSQNARFAILKKKLLYARN